MIIGSSDARGARDDGAEGVEVQLVGVEHLRLVLGELFVSPVVARLMWPRRRSRSRGYPPRSC